MEGCPVVGPPVRRIEDQRFITGKGRYTDDIDAPGQAYGYVLRSPTAQALRATLAPGEAALDISLAEFALRAERL